VGTADPDQKGRAVIARIRPAWREHKPSASLIGRTALAVLAVRAARVYPARQESIVYRRAHKAALEAPSWSTHNY
jgi:hypothetical protein